MLNQPETNNPTKEFKIPELAEINGMTKEQLHWALFCIDHKIKILTTEHQTALLEHNLTSQQELWNKRAELEKIQLAIKTKLNTRPL
jgi:hypothetical protein